MSAILHTYTKKSAFKRTFFSCLHLFKPYALLYTFKTVSLNGVATPFTANSNIAASAEGFTQLSGFASGILLRFNAVSNVLGTTTVVTTFFPLASSFMYSASLNNNDLLRPYATNPLPVEASNDGLAPMKTILPLLFCSMCLCSGRATL